MSVVWRAYAIVYGVCRNFAAGYVYVFKHNSSVFYFVVIVSVEAECPFCCLIVYSFNAVSCRNVMIIPVIVARIRRNMHVVRRNSRRSYIKSSIYEINAVIVVVGGNFEQIPARIHGRAFDSASQNIVFIGIVSFYYIDIIRKSDRGHRNIDILFGAVVSEVIRHAVSYSNFCPAHRIDAVSFTALADESNIKVCRNAFVRIFAYYIICSRIQPRVAARGNELAVLCRCVQSEIVRKAGHINPCIAAAVSRVAQGAGIAVYHAHVGNDESDCALLHQVSGSIIFGEGIVAVCIVACGKRSGKSITARIHEGTFI